MPIKPTTVFDQQLIPQIRWGQVVAVYNTSGGAWTSFASHGWQSHCIVNPCQKADGTNVNTAADRYIKLCGNEPASTDVGMRDVASGDIIGWLPTRKTELVSGSTTLYYDGYVVPYAGQEGAYYSFDTVSGGDTRGYDELAAESSAQNDGGAAGGSATSANSGDIINFAGDSNGTRLPVMTRITNESVAGTDEVLQWVDLAEGSIGELGDVDGTAPSDNDLLQYNSSSGDWEPTTVIDVLKSLAGYNASNNQVITNRAGTLAWEDLGGC